MKKMASIFSIILLLNILSNSKADLLGDLLGGLTGGLLGGVGNTLNQLLDHLKSLLNGILDLTQQELLKLVDVLNLLKSMGIDITDEKLKLTAQNVAIINGLTNGIWEAKLGFFSLLPDEDQKKLCGVFDIEIENIAGRDTSEVNTGERSKRQATQANCKYETEFDVRDKWPKCSSFINHVQHQGLCGSCWAISASSVYTDRHCIERDKKGLSTPNNASFTYSSFDVLACSPEKGCSGGWPHKAWDSIKSNGICTGTDFNGNNGCKPYPFKPTERYPILKSCKKSCTNTYWGVPYDTDRRNYVTSTSTIKGEQAIKEELDKNGPVVACFSVYKDFYSHADGSDGVYFHVWGDYDRSHAVVIVGYGTASCEYEKIPYWIIRNSWGTNSTGKGFLKFRRGNNECGIEQTVSFGIPKIN
uniref:Peptidase C1A papain C-terminal domain-containing protein n=1 Tax=Meloidogyne enterolobii TaxID=390850 RepID=A0A6V7WH27_MELEN|nr:unnamed protein product [Meloidogyne enterolobii]